MDSFLSKKIDLSLILNSISEGMFIIDKDEFVLFSNKVANEILQVDLTELFLRESLQFVKVMHVNQHQYLSYDEMPVVQAVRGKTIQDYKLFICHQNVENGMYLSVDAAPIRDGNNNILGAISTFRNITKDVLRERNILEERKFFQRLLDFIPALIMIKDLKGRYVHLNKLCTDTFPNMLGKTVYDVIPDKGERIDKETEEVIRTGKEIESQYEISHPDGSLHYYHTIRFPIYDNDGKMDGICVLGFDETQRIEQQKAVEAERIKSINASKLAALGTMAAEIGHEINNPLGIIKTSVAVIRNMLEEEESVETIRDQIEVIDKTTTRITDIVSALKHVSRDSNNERFSVVSLGELLNEVQVLCATKFKIKNIRLEIENQQVDLKEQIICLRVQTSQVLLNVVLNASDAVEGLSDPWVRLSLEKDENFIYFKITDSGPGVPLEVQHRIFEPFFTTKDIGAGTGLGLSIAKDIMIRQSGDIFLDSSECGNCFVIKILRKKPNNYV